LVIRGKAHSLTIFVKEGIIVDCEIKGSDEMALISRKLIGHRHMVEDLQKLFNKEEAGISKEEIYGFF
jgi:hypothetical protein